MKTILPKKKHDARPLNADKKKQARTVGGAGLRSHTACEADK